MGTTGGVAEADEGEGGIAAHHRGWIQEHLEQSFVEGGAGSVLAHDPGISVANFFDRVGGKTDHFWVPEAHARVVASHALTELNERVLDAAWVLFILEVFGDLFVGELASEPSVPPEEERHQDDQPGGNEKEGAIARGHFVMRG